MFIIGSNGRFIGKQAKLNEYLLSCKKIGINVEVCPVESFLSLIVNLTPEFEIDEVFKSGIKSSAELRVKTKTKENWQNTISSLLKKEV